MAHPGRPFKCDPKLNELRFEIEKEEFKTVQITLKEFGIDATDGERRTALTNSVIENKIEFVKWLIENGCNVNHQDRIGYTSLHFCAEVNNLEIAKILLKNGANPNLVDMHGNSPLWTAIHKSKGDKTMVEFLLRNNANADLLNKYNRSPAEMYKRFYNHDISDLLN